MAFHVMTSRTLGSLFHDGLVACLVDVAEDVDGLSGG